MILEKIVKYVKVAATNRLIPAGYALAGTSVGCALADGRISSVDIDSLSIAGTAAAILTLSFIMEQRVYKNVEIICENDGFTKNVIRDKQLRRKAKIYATESGRMNDFEFALNLYRI